jgi:superfamily II DNA or RNA helicase
VPQDKIIISGYNEVYVKIICEPSIAYEMSEHFSFYVPDYKYHPKFKIGLWDGKIKLLNLRTHLIYKGLVPHIKEFCEKRDYECLFDGDFSTNEFSEYEAVEFYKSLKIPEKFEQRDYHIGTFTHCIRNKRALFVSPTASGKSFMIYLIIRYLDTPTLIIVPNIQLVHQMYSDFKDYGLNVEKHVHKIHGGQEHASNKKIIISTWQSIYDESPNFFKKFKCVVGDEAHRCKAVSLTKILGYLTNCEYRFGFTGSLDGSLTNQMVLEGLFGPYKKIVSTVELQKQGYLADLVIKSIKLKYSDEVCKLLKKADYKQEVTYIIKNVSRNKFIRNLALSLKGNTLLLYQFVEHHGIPLFNMIKEKAEIPVYLIHGGIVGDEREEIRKTINEQLSSITVASMGCFSEGINIPNIDNIIIVSPTKSKIKVMQMIGRGLRKSERKKSCTLIDIADDFTWKSRQNYSLLHYIERISMYVSEGFRWKEYEVKLKD